MKPLKVILLESEQDLIEKLKYYYEKIFSLAGYKASCHGATSESAARKLVDQESPHVVICDMTFGNQNDGLIILRNLRLDFPDLFFILASRADYSSRDVFAKRAFFDLYFDKSTILAEDEDYVRESAFQFAEKFKINTRLQVDDSFTAYKSDFKSRAELREFASLLSQVTFTGHDSDDQITPDTAKISSLSGGFSGSKVYRFNTFNSASKLESVPAVLKVSKREMALEELNNYNKFVKWGLPYTWRVDVLGSGFTRRFGAVAYSFVLGGTGAQIKSLTQLLEVGDFQGARNVIDRIFSPDMRRWYGDELLEPQKNIIQRYSKRYFRGAESKRTSANAFQAICAKMFGATIEGIHLRLDDRRIPEPTGKLFGTPNGGFLSCICHGDLNSNNVIVSDVGDIIFIDFQETGRGHVFEDFVTMESSIRLYGKMPEVTNWRDYLAVESSIGLGEDLATLAEPHALIASVRRLAAKNFPSEPIENYFYALAAFSFRLLRAKLTDTQQRRCVAVLVASLTRF